ncbi:hypothetical protein EYF80_033655 [Liparis tanakae]|uniref:Uncharacterized protein n=1 Tax=Liparis tanakae TaxID=230148 RepID=A0A4Z2GSL2_9TELE|nr:hypothetical protein EYF80_033655 [Liparis tanakae]
MAPSSVQSEPTSVMLCWSRYSFGLSRESDPCPAACWPPTATAAAHPSSDGRDTTAKTSKLQQPSASRVLCVGFLPGLSSTSPYFSSASTTAKSAASLVDSKMVLYGMLGFRLSAYILKVPPAGNNETHTVLVMAPV